jgi:transposase-like protein
MRQLSFKRHRFPPEIIRHSIWLYARFTLSFRDVEAGTQTTEVQVARLGATLPQHPLRNL